MQFEYDFTNLRSNIPQSQVVKDKLGPIVKESNSPAVVLVDNKSDLLALEQVINEKIGNDPTPTIDKFKSIYTMLPDRQQQKLALIAELKDLIDDGLLEELSPEEKERAEELLSYTEVESVDVTDLPEEVLRLFRGKDGTTGEFAYIYAKVRLADARNAFSFADDVRNLKIPSGKVFNATNSSIIFADMLTMMLREGKRAIAVTFLAVFLLVLIDLRNFKQTLLVLTPLLIGILWLTAFMFLFKIKLTTMVGFSGLIFAFHPGLNAIGELALIGISLTLLAALVILPAVFQLQASRKVKPLK